MSRKNESMVTGTHIKETFFYFESFIPSNYTFRENSLRSFLQQFVYVSPLCVKDKSIAHSQI